MLFWLFRAPRPNPRPSGPAGPRGTSWTVRMGTDKVGSPPAGGRAPAGGSPGSPRVDATAACRGALCQAARRVRLVPSPEPAGRSWHGTARGAPCRAGWLAARLHAALGMESSKKPHWSVLASIGAMCDKRGDAAGAGTTSAEGDHARGLAGCGACEGRGVRRGACASSAARVACAGRGGPDGRGGRGYRARGDRRTCRREPRGRGGAAVLRGGASTAGPNPGSLPHCLQ